MQSRLFAKLLVVALTVCAVVLGTGSTASAAEVCDPPTSVKVPASGTVIGSGTAGSCTESALRAAVAAGGHVTFQCGGGAVTIPVTRELSVTKTTVVDGGGRITLDGGGTSRILVATDRTTLSVRNLRLVNGAATQSSSRKTGTGGAVAGLYQTRVEVIGSTFQHNTAGIGGGAVAVGTDSSLSIVGSTFTGNSSWYGGAVYSLLSPLTVINSTFSDNSTTTSGGLGDGGAIGTDGAAPIDKGGVIRVCGSAFTHNTGHGNGGGGYFWAYALDQVVIERTTFKDNTVKPNGRGGNGLGGAARVSIGPTDHNRTGKITISASSFLSNASEGNGGALYLDCSPTCSIDNSTFHGNSAESYGGAIFGDGHHDNNVTFANNAAGGQGGALFGTNVVLDNTVLVGNTARNPWGLAMTCSSTGKGAHVLQWLSSTRDRSKDCVSGVVSADPQLAAPAANGGPTLTLMPASTSPVLNAGSGCEPRDQRGSARNVSACDLGAVQRTPVAPASSAVETSAAAAQPNSHPARDRQQVLDGSSPVEPEPGSGGFVPAALIGTGGAAVVAALAALSMARGLRTRTSEVSAGSSDAAGR